MTSATEIGERQRAADLADLHTGDDEAGGATGQTIELLDSGDHRDDVRKVHALKDGGQTEDEQKDLLARQSLQPFGPEVEQATAVVQILRLPMAGD